VLWLDRFATGEPITDATLEVETPAGPASPAGAGAAALPPSAGARATASDSTSTSVPAVTVTTTEKLAARDPGAGLFAAGGFVLGLAAMALMRAGRRAPVLAVLVLAATLVRVPGRRRRGGLAALGRGQGHRQRQHVDIGAGRHRTRLTPGTTTKAGSRRSGSA
jgi:hypothetical protein